MRSDDYHLYGRHRDGSGGGAAEAGELASGAAGLAGGGGAESAALEAPGLDAGGDFGGDEEV